MKLSELAPSLAALLTENEYAWAETTSHGYKQRFRVQIVTRHRNPSGELNGIIRVEVVSHENNWTQYKDGDRLDISARHLKPEGS